MPSNEDNTRGFSLIELLVVIAIVALLVGLLAAALSASRAGSRLSLCVANVRSQMQLVSAYSNDFQDVLPPKVEYLTELDENGMVVSAPWLMNRLLARWNGELFRGEPGYESPTGVWRCPDVSPEQDGTDRWTHAGVLHHAPNTWAFSTFVVDEVHGTLSVTSEAYGSWYWRFGGGFPRRMGDFPRTADVIGLIDNTTSYVAAHGHFDARQSCGLSVDVVKGAFGEEATSINYGSHDALSRRPAAFLDGHAEAVPSTHAYWFDGTSSYAVPGHPSMLLNHREVERFMWYAQPETPTSGDD